MEDLSPISAARIARVRCTEEDIRPVQVLASRLAGNNQIRLCKLTLLCYLQLYPIMPENFVQLITIVKENPQLKTRYHQYMLSRFSKFFMIDYPGGVEAIFELCELFLTGIVFPRNNWSINYPYKSGKTSKLVTFIPKIHFTSLMTDEEKFDCENQHAKNDGRCILHVQRSPTHSVDIVKLRFAWFCARVIIRRPRLEQKGHDTDISFSLIEYNRPHNRLASIIGAEKFCRISFEYPAMDVEDLLQDKKLAFMIGSVTDSRNSTPQALPFSLVVMLELMGVDPELTANFRKIAHQLNSDAEQKMLKPSGELLKEIKIANCPYRMISCNIAGALKNVYTFMACEDVNIFNLHLDTIFSCPSDVISDDKPMLPPLRVGLLNTTGIETIAILETQMSTIPDIVFNGEILTDGCGELTLETAYQVFEQYKSNWFPEPEIDATQPESVNDNFLQETEQHIPGSWLSANLPDPKTLPSGYVPSAYQIRIKGYKGMVVVSSTAKSPVQFRDSMLKFESAISPHLWIAGLSAPARNVVLSSELVYLFETSCSPQFAFKLECFLSDIITEHRLDCGGDSLKNLLTPNSQAEKKYAINMTKHEKEILESGYGIMATSHFISRILRMNVPIPKSATVYGVADHRQILAPDEIFLQITNRRGRCEAVIGDILITKSPALTKQDIVRFKAVAPAELVCNNTCKGACDHPRDIIVFSVTGCRSPASLMASADLDGDTFHAFFDPRLISLLDKPSCAPSITRPVVHSPTVPLKRRMYSNITFCKGITASHDFVHLVPQELREAMIEIEEIAHLMKGRHVCVLPTLETRKIKWHIESKIIVGNLISVYICMLLLVFYLFGFLWVVVFLLPLILGMWQIRSLEPVFVGAGLRAFGWNAAKCIQTFTSKYIRSEKPCTMPWHLALERSAVKLSEPINSKKICGLGHLLCLRRLFVDFNEAEWGNDACCQQLATWITRTLEAPKHGRWVEWEEVRKEIKASSIPKYPHYHSKIKSLDTRHSTSLYGKLYDIMMEYIGFFHCQNTIVDHSLLITEDIASHLYRYHRTEGYELFAGSKQIVSKINAMKHILSTRKSDRCTALLAAVYAHYFPTCFTKSWNQKFTPEILQRCQAPLCHLHNDRIGRAWLVEEALRGAPIEYIFGTVANGKLDDLFRWRLAFGKYCLPYTLGAQMISNGKIVDYQTVRVVDLTGQLAISKYNTLLSKYCLNKLEIIKNSGTASAALWKYIAILQTKCGKVFFSAPKFYSAPSPQPMPHKSKFLHRSFTKLLFSEILEEWGIVTNDHKWDGLHDTNILENIFYFSSSITEKEPSLIMIKNPSRSTSLCPKGRGVRGYQEFLRKHNFFCVFDGPNDPSLQCAMSIGKKIARLFNKVELFYLCCPFAVVLAIHTPPLLPKLLQKSSSEDAEEMCKILNTMSSFISRNSVEPK